MTARDPRVLLAVFAGGGTGGLVRVWLAEAYPHDATAWPWTTFAVNMVAALLLGALITSLEDRPPTTYRRPLLGTGVCGGLSTFSTMQLELVKMLDHDAYGLAVAYTAASLAGGYLAVVAATKLVRHSRTSA